MMLSVLWQMYMLCSFNFSFIMPRTRKMEPMQNLLVHVITFTLLFGSFYVKGREYVFFQDNNDSQCKLSGQKHEDIQWKYGIQGSYFTNNFPNDNNSSLNDGVYASHHHSDETIINCTYHDIFIVPSIQENNKKKSEILTETKSLEEHENTTISCRFNRTNFAYALFWVVVHPNCSNQCLASVELDSELYKFKHNKLCCSEYDSRRSVYDKRGSVTDSTHQFELQINDLKPSDNGRYLCIIYILSKGQGVWKLPTNTSLIVHLSPKEGQNKFIHVGTGILGGIIILTGIILLTVCCTKSKGKQMDSHSRQSDAVDHLENDECTPYAVSNRTDLQEDPGTVYSIVHKPEEEYSKGDPGACMAYSVLEIQRH